MMIAEVVTCNATEEAQIWTLRLEVGEFWKALGAFSEMSNQHFSRRWL